MLKSAFGDAAVVHGEELFQGKLKWWKMCAT